MNLLKKIISVATAFFIVATLMAQESVRQLSLNQACQLGLDENLEVQNATLEAQKMYYQQKEAKSKLYPQLQGYSDLNYYYAIPKMLMPGEMFGQTGEVAVEIGTKYDLTGGLKASLTIFDQSYYTSLKIAKRLSSLSELSLDQRKEELVYQISQVYYLCKITTQQISYLEDNMDKSNQLLEILKLQNENGMIRKIDYLKVLVNKNNLQTVIDNTNQLYEQQLSLLKYLTGLDMHNPIKLTDSLTYTQTNLLNDELPSLDNRTELKLLDKQLEVAELNRKANLQGYIPTLSGSGQFFYQGQQNDFNYFDGGADKFFKVGVIGVSLNIPIFDGFEKHYKAKQLNIALLQLQNTRKNTTDGYTKDYTDAMRQYKNSLNALLRQEVNIKVAEEDYNVNLQGYRQQVVSLSDLMLSKNSWSEARLAYSNALLQFKNAELEVKKSKGELLNF